MKLNRMELGIILILFSVCMSIFSCKSHTLTPLGYSMDNDMDAMERIDVTSYEKSVVYSMPGVGYFKFINVPGMVLYTDQSHGATLSYVNKASHKSFYFCFDPTCTHYECPANILHLTNQMVYCRGRIYAVRPEPELGGAGTMIYSVGLDATDLKVCYRGNGNEICNLLVYGDEIYFTQMRTDGGRDVLAYDVDTGKVKTVSIKTDLDIERYFVANNEIYFTFIGDTFLYKTIDCFETCDRLFDVAKMSNMQYGDNSHIYGIEYRMNEKGELNSKAIIRCSLIDGTIDTVYESLEDRIFLAGIDDMYCYFYHITQRETPYKRSDGTPITNGSGGVLYRISKTGGERETVIDNIEYNISCIEKYEEDLYVTGHKYYQRGKSGVSTTFTGVLTDGVIEEIVPR